MLFSTNFKIHLKIKYRSLTPVGGGTVVVLVYAYMVVGVTTACTSSVYHH